MTQASQHLGSILLVFRDGGDHDLPRLAQERQGVGNSPPRLRTILPGHERAAQIEPANRWRHYKHRPPHLHH